MTTAMTKIVLSLVVVMVWLCAPALIPGVPAADQKDLVAEAQKIQNDQRPFKIEIWTEENKTTYKTGDTVTFLFKTDRDCFVTLIDIGTSGAVTRIFPNEWHQSNQVKAGETYRIPVPDASFVFRVKPPAGIEFIKAIATLEPLKAVATAQQEAKGSFVEFKAPGALLKDVGVELNGKDKKTWADADLSFQIAEEAATASVPQEKPFQIKLWTEKTVYKIGEPIVFSFQSDKECYLTLIDIGTSGKVTIIFPNQYSQSNKIEAGKVYRIPPDGSDAAFAYKVATPPGVETIKAIGTLDPGQVPPGQVSFDKQVYPELGQKDKVLKDIETTLQKIGPARHSETDLTIEIQQ